ncbi:MAG: TIR domain-containing protein [Verrucomicrobia bacterium]|nr:TIR domain-containing protein [Verrucomicrobiota bacterium]
MKPLFFLSYFRADARSGNIERFYKELVTIVRSKAAVLDAVKDEDVGFFDQRGIKAGDSWPDVLSEQLNQCGTMVCLYSPGYFQSEFCGKEFGAFRSRLTQPGGKLLPLILPVLWERPDLLPDPLPGQVPAIQFKEETFGQLYADEGLDYLIRVKGDQSGEYQQFAKAFAQRLVKVAQANPNLPPVATLASLEKAPNAFSPTVVFLPPGPKPVGPRKALFVIVAGLSTQYEGVRNMRGCYDPEDVGFWRPFDPDMDKAVSMMCLDAAQPEHVFPDVLPPTPDLVEMIREADKTNRIVILLVDGWSVRIKSFKQILEAYNAAPEAFVNCGILITWNEKDPETMCQQSTLLSELGQTLSRCVGSNQCSYFEHDIRSPGKLEEHIRSAIAEIRKRLIRKNLVLGRVRSDRTLPLISS